MSKFSRWFPTIHAAMKNIDANFEKEDGPLDIDLSKFFRKYPAKRIVFLAILSGIIFAEKIQWNHPFRVCTIRSCYSNPEAFLLFVGFIIAGLMAWSFWDEYQASKK